LPGSGERKKEAAHPATRQGYPSVVVDGKVEVFILPSQSGTIRFRKKCKMQKHLMHAVVSVVVVVVV
jgi:hypothetical protein